MLNQEGQPQVTSIHSSRNGAAILLVEDNDDLRENAALVLSLEGYRVFPARDGLEALHMLTSGECKPDLIVSDIAMPNMDGYEFFDAIHKMPTLRSVPFIFLTARGSAHDIRFGKKLGVDDYLPKPFNADDFLVAVSSKLKRTREIRDDAEHALDDARRILVQLMSHELRTPLTYVAGGFSLLAEHLEQGEMPSDMQTSMSLIHSGTQRLNRLAEQMVIYAELVSGHARMQLDKLGAPCDLEQMARDAIQRTQRELVERGTRFLLDAQTAEPLEIVTIPEFLVDAFYEVLRNAAQYSPEGSDVLVTLAAEDGHSILTVTDHGRGIASDDQATIWEILVQSERQKHEQQGAGMGLPIVKQTMLLHGGQASLHSEVNAGTVVTLRLPLYRGEA